MPDMCISKILGLLGQQARKKVAVVRSWGSHGVSVSGVYWERWRESTSEEMSEADFAKVSAEFTALKELDWAEMVAGDQRPVYHLAKQS